MLCHVPCVQTMTPLADELLSTTLSCLQGLYAHKDQGHCVTHSFTHLC